MEHYDLIVSASCYFSPEHAIRLIRSTPVIDGRVLTVITCPRAEDAESLKQLLEAEPVSTSVIVLRSDRKERHLCQDLGVLYCVSNEISSKYLMFADDDIEFVKTNIIHTLDTSPQFCAFGFSSNWITYGESMKGEEQHGKWVYNIGWIDGHGFIVHWDDIFKYGLFDQVPGYWNSSSVEVEIMHRYRTLSNLPAIGCAYAPIIHHSRVDGVEKTRNAVNDQSPIHCGLQLWAKKFGLTYGSGDFNSGRITWDDVYKVLSNESYLNNYKKHLILDGIWLDYALAWEKFCSGLHLVLKEIK